ncbi:hypothetical protein Rhe02_65360 [Rhizocola hellebori]|uniref:Uncharacterized protein n=1 Tax=Rhizocola hellebori TaxID=1392758 RepID=A0A8J3VIK0_9ACTN|nr:hypothetical protein [Rhizocola hellebori]GIH08469.1 hypothetical protein Rhe02_65360 [Rhizocola hellebori]
MQVAEIGEYGAAADRVAVLARRLEGVVDLPTAEHLADLLIDVGWVADAARPPGLFTAGGLKAAVRVERGTSSVGVTLANLGGVDDIDDDDFADDAAYQAAREQPYLDAEVVVEMVAGRLGLPSADALAVDELADYGCRVRLRAGHWAVTVAAVQHDADLPVLVEVDLSYGADLPGRLCRLVVPPSHPESAAAPVDWDAVSGRLGVELPQDYRWLIEHYGSGVFDGYLTLMAPAALSKPVLGELRGVLRYMTGFTLPVATTDDGAVVSWVVDSWQGSDRWHVRVTSPGTEPWHMHTGLLQFLVTTLSGAYRVPPFRPGFPSPAPHFTPA